MQDSAFSSTRIQSFARRDNHESGGDAPMKRQVLIFCVVASSSFAIAGVAFGLQPHLISLALKRLALGSFGEGTACVGDNQCTSGHCRLVMPDAGPGSAAQCCSMGGESCTGGSNSCCAESGLACTSSVCCQSSADLFCEGDVDCCINPIGKPAAAVNQCHDNVCRWCIPTGAAGGRRHRIAVALGRTTQGYVALHAELPARPIPTVGPMCVLDSSVVRRAQRL